MTVQLRRAAIAVPARIAEGCGRENDAAFATQLHKARGASAELAYLLLLCRDLGYLPSEEADRLAHDVIEIQKMIAGLVRRL